MYVFLSQIPEDHCILMERYKENRAHSHEEREKEKEKEKRLSDRRKKRKKKNMWLVF